MDDSVIVVGAGQAASQAVETLRVEGHGGPITLVGDESLPPYQRPPLSKKYLAGEIDAERLQFKTASQYARLGVETCFGIRVERIDRQRRLVRLGDGSIRPYSKLLLATGSRARRTEAPGADLGGIHYLRSAADVDAFRGDFVAGKRLVIVGGGYIGLEVAAVAVKRGLLITVLESASRVMSRVVSPAVSRAFQRIHEEEGVTLHTSATVERFEGQERVRAVVCQDGRRVDADLVLVAVGNVPNVELAQDCGLQVDNGVVVDEYGRTSDPDIYAAGDCASSPSVRHGRRLRLECVGNAIELAKVAATSICGKRRPYDPHPWFWSDQYDIKLQIAGLSAGYDEVAVRGDIDHGRSFAVFYLREGRIIAVDAVNRSLEFMVGKQLVTAGAYIEPERLSDDARSLKALLKPLHSTDTPI